MKLYQTKYIVRYNEVEDGPDNTEGVSWTGTQADARADRKRLKGEDMKEIVTEEIEVPVAKAALMAFLNDHKVI